MLTINMMSSAYKIKGQGVLSAHDEQVSLVKEINQFEVEENKIEICNITHFHTVNLEYFLWTPFLKNKSTTAGYVHFVPETLENSLHLIKPIKNIFYKYLIAFYNRMDKLVVVNPYFIDVLNNYGISKDKVTYIPNYVSKSKFYPLDMDSKNKIREEYNIPEDKFVVLSVGQLQKRKGVTDFIEIARSMPDTEFIWAGDAVFGKMSEGYDEIKNVIKNNLPSNVHFLGLINRDKMNEVYNMADVMFLPSYEELFPMSIFEAMCVNLPILTRDLDIYNGILFDFYLYGDSTGDFIEQIKKLKEDKEYYEHAKEKSKEGNIFYGKENVKKMWEDFYENCVKYKVIANGKEE